MNQAVVPISEIDLFSDEVLADPFPYYKVLRDTGPVVFMSAGDFFAIPGYAETRALLNDWETFSSHRGVSFSKNVNDQLAGTILGSDPPLHTQMRKVLSSRLAPRALRGLRDDISDRARRYVERFRDHGEFDAVEDFAQNYVVDTIMDVIGLPEDARERLPSFGIASFNVLGPDNDRAAGALQTFGEIFTTYLPQVATRDRLRPGSMGAAVYEAADRGELPAESTMPLLSAYIGAGIDTTVITIVSAVVLFAQHPDEWEKLRRDRSLVSAALNEVLRYDAPVQMFGRRTTESCEIASVPLPADAQVGAMFGSANRDERHYPDADQFRIERNPVDHLGFGNGIHGCAGQGLARMEVEAMFQALADSVARFECTNVERELNNTARTFKRALLSMS